MTDRIGLGYAYFQLAKFKTLGNAAKVAEWEEAIAAMRAGDVTVGSRSPLAETPVWVTPKVMRGGFARGDFAAGGPLQAHEIALAEEIRVSTTDAGLARAALNGWYASPEGQDRLREMASTGAFDAQTPEETALLVMAVSDAPQDVLEELEPFFDRLRFFPRPSAPLPERGVFLRSVAQVRRAMAGKQTSDQIIVQDATLSVWIPLYDRLVDLLAIDLDADAARVWVTDYAIAEGAPMARRWSDPKGSFQRCRAALSARLKGTPGDEAFVRLVVARRQRKYGDKAARDQWRASQACQKVSVRLDAMGEMLAKRLAPLRPDAGVVDVEPLLAPVSDQEAGDGLPVGTPIPPGFAAKIAMLQTGAVADHVAEGRIPSPEVLATVLPQVSAEVQAFGFADPAQTHAYKALYQAFRKRRSLLLLNYESQVRLDELPWVAPLNATRQRGADGTARAVECLRETAALSLTHFPHVQFPNPMVQELMALSKAAELDLPLTSELAADIFMGGFSKTFEQAATLAITRYAPTIYGSYYGITPDMAKRRLDHLAHQLAGIRQGGNWSVVKNAMVIEQQLILTTHNLAPLFAHLELSNLDLSGLSRNTFMWICADQQVRRTGWRARLQAIKNAAYAWRQMLVFLAEMSPDEQRAALQLINGHFADQPQAFQDLFAPAMIGLNNAATGRAVETVGGVKFLGWVQGQHPFDAPADDD